MAHSIEINPSVHIDIDRSGPDEETPVSFRAVGSGVVNEGWFQWLGGVRANVSSMLARNWFGRERAQDDGRPRLIEHRGGTLQSMKAMLPTMLWTSVVDGVKHYRGTGWFAPMGQLSNLLTSPSYYDFVKDVRSFGDGPDGPSHEAISFFLFNRACLLVQDAEDVTSVFKTDKITQASKPGEAIGPLIAFQELFGVRNPILQDPFENGEKNKVYARLRTMFTTRTMVDSKLNDFAASEMGGIIDRHLRAAADKTEPMDLTCLLTGMVMDIPAALLADYRNPAPSIFYQRPETNNRELLEEALVSLANPIYFVSSGSRVRAVEEVKRGMLEFAKEMIGGNYEAIRAAGSENMIRDLWEFNLGKEQEFPTTFDGLISLLENGANEQREAVEMFLLGAGFLQLASTETSAQALNFAVRELLKRPDWLREIRNELSTADFDPSGFKLTELSKSHPKLCAFLVEILRRYPPVPVPPFIATETYAAKLGGRDVTIEKGTWIWKDIERANQSGTFAADGTEFRPERWLEMDGSFDALKFLKGLQSDRNNFFTFSGGISDKAHSAGHSRVCPGRLLAFSEMAMTVARLVAQYDFHAQEEDVSLEYTAGSTLKPTRPLHLVLTPLAPRRESEGISSELSASLTS